MTFLSVLRYFRMLYVLFCSQCGCAFGVGLHGLRRQLPHHSSQIIFRVFLPSSVHCVLWLHCICSHFRPSNRGNPWKIGNYENEALTNTFVEMITQFWLCQNNQTLLENVRCLVNLPFLLSPEPVQNPNGFTIDLNFNATLLYFDVWINSHGTHHISPIFQPQEPVKPPKGVHSPGTAPTVPWEADSLRAQSMLLYVYDLDETQSTSLFDQLILPLLYQFLKVTLASVDVGQTDRLQYLNKVFWMYFNFSHSGGQYMVSCIAALETPGISENEEGQRSPGAYPSQRR